MVEDSVTSELRFAQKREKIQANTRKLTGFLAHVCAETCMQQGVASNISATTLCSDQGLSLRYKFQQTICVRSQINLMTFRRAREGRAFNNVR